MQGSKATTTGYVDITDKTNNTANIVHPKKLMLEILLDLTKHSLAIFMTFIVSKVFET